MYEDELHSGGGGGGGGYYNNEMGAFPRKFH